MQEKKVVSRVFFTIFFFSLLGGIYVVVNAWVHPNTLGLPLTHFASWPREDTFGIISWIVAFFSFLIWNLERK